MAHLTPDERDRYRHDGYVVPGFRLAAQKVDRLRIMLDRLIRDNPTIRPERLVSAHIEGRNAEGVSGSRDFLELAMEPDIVDLAADAIGPDVVLWGCQIFCKPGGDGLEVPWHQDGHYWPIRPLATCTVWLALDSSTRANGCLRVIPGSHAGRRLHPHMTEDRSDVVLNQRVHDEAFDAAGAVDIELAPGQVSLHDVYMIHGSNPNRSPDRRAGVAIRYMPGSSVFERGLIERSDKSGYTVDFSTRPLWLLRGRDRTGRNDFAIGHRQDALQ
jgi:hypothetical protein